MNPSATHVWRTGITILIFSCILLKVYAAPTSNPSDIESFVNDIYIHYHEGNSGLYLGGDQAKKILTRSLRTLVDHDIKLLHGETGVLGADPLCGCQDFDIKEVHHIDVQLNTEGSKATVIIKFRNLDISETITLDLMKTKDGWRIDDISYAGMPSLRKALQREISALSVNLQ